MPSVGTVVLILIGCSQSCHLRVQPVLSNGQFPHFLCDCTLQYMSHSCYILIILHCSFTNSNILHSTIMHLFFFVCFTCVFYMCYIHVMYICYICVIYDICTTIYQIHPTYIPNTPNKSLHLIADFDQGFWLRCLRCIKMIKSLKTENTKHQWQYLSYYYAC